MLYSVRFWFRSRYVNYWQPFQCDGCDHERRGVISTDGRRLLCWHCRWSERFHRFVDWFDEGGWEEMVGKVLIVAVCVLVPLVVLVQVVRAVR